MASNKILIVEQEKEFALSLAAVLSGTNHSFCFVDRGKDALEEATELKPDLIILRAELPDVSGYTLCTQFRKSKVLQDVPVIFMSSEATEQALEQHRNGKYPADAYLIMPFDMEEFQEKVFALVGRGDLEASTAGAEAGQHLRKAEPAGALEEPRETASGALDQKGWEGGLDEWESPVEEGQAQQGEAKQPWDESREAGSEAEQVAKTFNGDVETVDDSSIVGTLDGAVAAGPPELPKERRFVSEKDLEFVEYAFESIKDSRKVLGAEEEKARGKTARKKTGPKGGLEEKLEFLREKLKQREMEIARLAKIWEAKEREFSAFNEKILDKEVEVQGLKMRLEDLERKLEESRKDAEQQAREFKASVDTLMEEKVVTENDLIQVIAEKEKQINDMRIGLSQKEREKDLLEKDLLGKIKAGEEQYVLLIEKLQSTMQQAASQEQEAQEVIYNQQQTIASNQEDIQKLRQELRQLEGAKENVERDVRALLGETEQRAAKLETDLQALAEEKQSSERSLQESLDTQTELADALQAELNELREAVQEQSRDYQEKFEQREEKIISLDDTIGNLQREKTEQQQRLAARLDEREAKIAVLEGDLAALREAKSAQEQRLGERLSEREQKIETQEEELNELRQALLRVRDDIEVQLREQQGTINSLEQQLIIAQKDKDLAQNDLDRLGAELRERDDESSRRHATLEEISREKEEALAAADLEISERDRIIAELREENELTLNDRDRRLEQLRSELEVVQEERLRIEKELEAARGQATEGLSTIRDEFEEERSRLEQELMGRQQLVQQLTEDLQTLQQSSSLREVELTERLAEAESRTGELGQQAQHWQAQFQEELARVEELQVTFERSRQERASRETALKEKLFEAETRAGELADELSRSTEQLENTRAEVRGHIKLWEDKLSSLNEQLAMAQEQENRLRQEYQEKLQENNVVWEERVREERRSVQGVHAQVEQLENERKRFNQVVAEAKAGQDQMREALTAAKREREQFANRAVQMEEAVRSSIREKEETELRYIQEMESKQDHYIKELERVRSSHIAEMTKINHNYLQRGKALKIAEMEVQRLKEKVAELERRPLAAPGPRAAAHHDPGSGPAPLRSGAGSEGGDLDIDQMLSGLKERE